MAWRVTVHFVRGELHRRETVVPTPALGPAVESALHELKFSNEVTGSYQITVTQRGDDEG